MNRLVWGTVKRGRSVFGCGRRCGVKRFSGCAEKENGKQSNTDEVVPPDIKPVQVGGTSENDFGRQILPFRAFNRLAQTAQVSWGLSRISFENIARPQTFLILSASFVYVYYIGYQEGLLLCQDPLSVPAKEFSKSYAWHNVLPSIVWSSHPAELIALSLDMETTSLLRDFTNVDSVSAAQDLLQAKTLAIQRSVVAGFMAIAQILRIVNITLKSWDTWEHQVALGRQRCLNRGTGERVLRLCGADSDTTRLALRRYGSHIFPVYEGTAALEKTILFQQSCWRPKWWQLNPLDYGDRRAWEAVGISADWSLNTRSGKRVLVVEADAMNEDAAMMLGRPGADLKIEEASSAFRVIDSLMTNTHCDRVMKVFLADSLQNVLSGSTKYTLSDFIEESGEADVLIDATAPLVQELLRWCYRMKESSESNKIIFHTRSEEYFKLFEELLGSYSYEILHPSKTSTKEYPDASRIVYESSTSLTVNSVETLFRQGVVDTGRICALVEKYEGVDELREMETRYPDKSACSVICSAQIHDDIFREVRVWTRMDYSPEQIQKALNRRFRAMLFQASSASGRLKSDKPQ